MLEVLQCLWLALLSNAEKGSGTLKVVHSVVHWLLHWSTVTLHLCSSPSTPSILIISSEQWSDVLSVLFNPEMHLCCYGDNEQNLTDFLLFPLTLLQTFAISCPLRHWPTEPGRSWPAMASHACFIASVSHLCRTCSQS